MENSLADELREISELMARANETIRDLDRETHRLWLALAVSWIILVPAVGLHFS